MSREVARGSLSSVLSLDVAEKCVEEFKNPRAGETVVFQDSSGCQVENWSCDEANEGLG